MEKTKKTILIVNRNVSYEQLETISDNFNKDRDICMTGYGIEIWEKDLITGELKLIRADNEKIEKIEKIQFGDLRIERPVENKVDEDPLDELFVEKHDVKSCEHAFEEKTKELAEKEVPVKRKRTKILSDNADKFLQEHYKDSIDRELAETIKKVFGEEYTSDQIKEARKRLGLKKEKNRRNQERNGKPRTKWTEEHFEWLRENVENYGNAELHKKLIEKFDLGITLNAMQARMCLVGIRRENRTAMPKPKEETKPVQAEKPFGLKAVIKENVEKSKRKGMSEKAISIIEDDYMTLTDGELREKIADKTGAFHPSDKIADYRESNGMARPEGWNPEDYDDNYLEEEN